MLDRLSKIYRRVRDERGVSLVEVVLIMVILGITVVPLSRLSVANLKSSGRYATITKAAYYAEEVMEQIIADYAAEDAGRGYDWVVANWPGSAPNPPTGFSGNVSISAEDTLNNVIYVVAQVAVSGSEIPDLVLTTWLVK